MLKHLVFYDGECGFCDATVQFIMKRDRKKIFLFAPLQGETAKKELKDLPPELKSVDSVILLENYLEKDQKTYLLGQAGFRILWLLGGVWKLIGWVAFLPSFLYNWGYRLIARNRYLLGSKIKCVIPDPSQKERFLS